MTRRNNVWSVDLAGGGVRQGRDTYYDVFPVSVTLITSAMGRQAFLSFLEKVDGGASSFWMAHDFGMGIEDYQVTITSTIAESTEDGINWTITFTATAEKSPFRMKITSALFTIYQICMVAMATGWGASLKPTELHNQRFHEFGTLCNEPGISRSRLSP